jgi:N-acetylglucosamine kinase-like BadF-type ATPase
MRVVPRKPRSVRALAAGVDIGGTWTRVALSDGRHVSRLRRRALAVPELRNFLLTVSTRRRGRLAAAVVAARGVWTARERGRLARDLRGVAARIVVLSDAQAAFLGALGEVPGVLILAGTGSIVLGRDASGHWSRAGGLGPLLGDDGSAFWIGRQWLRANSEGASAGLRGGTSSGRPEGASSGHPEADGFMHARRLVRSPDPVAKIAALAPSVVARARDGDRLALTIVREAQAALAVLGMLVACRLRLSAPVDVSWAGSVMNDRWFRTGVARTLSRVGLRARWRTPQSEPVVAVARLAARLARLSRADEPDVPPTGRVS